MCTDTSYNQSALSYLDFHHLAETIHWCKNTNDQRCIMYSKSTFYMHFPLRPSKWALIRFVKGTVSNMTCETSKGHIKRATTQVKGKYKDRKAILTLLLPRLVPPSIMVTFRSESSVRQISACHVNVCAKYSIKVCRSGKKKIVSSAAGYLADLGALGTAAT